MNVKLRAGFIYDKNLRLKGRGKGIAIYDFDGNKVATFGEFRLASEQQGETDDYFFGFVEDNFHQNKKTFVFVKITVGGRSRGTDGDSIQFYPGNDPQFFDKFEDFETYRSNLADTVRFHKKNLK